jgi:hypothetical protein
VPKCGVWGVKCTTVSSVSSTAEAGAVRAISSEAQEWSQAGETEEPGRLMPALNLTEMLVFSAAEFNDCKRRWTKFLTCCAVRVVASSSCAHTLLRNDIL